MLPQLVPYLLWIKSLHVIAVIAWMALRRVRMR